MDHATTVWPASGGGSPGGRPAGAAALGESVGPYVLLEVIGTGGFGTVYLAERREPMVQRVAVKVLNAGMDSREVVARFEQERQTLALMDHPNVARVFDGGTTGRGLPFFVMEYVGGRPITSHCDGARLTARERVELFVPVCRAVGHAHQKGIIHRDLKPSNILVAEHDGAAVPKVIDFGVAKAVAAGARGEGLRTEYGRLVGTPEYMSPEQASSGGADVDTRTDVYSLGVVLYEVLTGVPPLELASGERASLLEIMNAVRDFEPRRPSTRVSRAGPRTGEVAARRRSDPSSLARALRGDLDCVVMRALEKDRERRYGSVLDLAADLENYLRDRPVSAGSPGAWYRAGKFVRRHRVGAIASAGLGLAVVVGTAGTGVGLVEALEARDAERRERGAAEEARAQAERERVKAEAVSVFLREMLASPDPAVAQGREPTVREMLGRAGEQAGRSFAGAPETEAAVRLSIGVSLDGLGRYAEAAEQLERALALLRGAGAGESLDVVSVLASLGAVHTRWGQLGEAERYIEEGLARMEQIRPGPHALTAALLNSMAEVVRVRGDMAQAEEMQRRALEMRRGLFGESHADTARSMNNLGLMLHQQGRTEEAEGLYRASLEARRGLLGENHPEVAQSMHNLGSLLQTTGRMEEAAAMLRETVAVRRRVLGDSHPDLAVTLNSLGSTLARTDEREAAEAAYRESVAIARQSMAAGHPFLGAAIGNLADALTEAGKYDEAEGLHHEALELDLRAYGEGSVEVTAERIGLGKHYLATERAAEAEEQFRAALAAAEARQPRLPLYAGSIRYSLGTALLRQGKHEEAEGMLLSSYEVAVEADRTPERASVRKAAERLAELYASWGKAGAAAEWRERASAEPAEGR